MGIHFRERGRCVPVWLTIEPATRARIEAAIENLVALLDQIDGDYDQEYDTADLEPDGTDEPRRVTPATRHDQRQWAHGHQEGSR
ncbi:hypothetical protein H1W37_03775 [Stappia taiwanensis]|uniref:Uncharacterized protein n=1 Tax=Stappia taiwanensis TaxID=992267 RepID=A0A838XQ90_9HYPH|nr:hypothetical protein [Stappia taiwanensis]MBA4610756.1 hypothetical protein [Stappia taiwanensis]GGE96167.1 hypothetical protein GCM10007285_24770 [Stappia taiwanensis]